MVVGHYSLSFINETTMNASVPMAARANRELVSLRLKLSVAAAHQTDVNAAVNTTVAVFISSQGCLGYFDSR